MVMGSDTWHVFLPLFPSFISLFVTVFATQPLVNPLKSEILATFGYLNTDQNDFTDTALSIAEDWHFQIATYSDFILFFPSWYTAMAAFGEQAGILRLIGWFFFGVLGLVYVLIPIMKSRIGQLSIEYTTTANISWFNKKFLRAKSDADFYAKLLIAFHLSLLIANVVPILQSKIGVSIPIEI